MKHNGTRVDKERATRNLLHEAQVVTSLGEHELLPLVLGVITKKEPLCFVTKFHDVKDQSVTLHQAANSNFLTPRSCTDIFVQICSALQHVHSKGFLHNDIKANNVVLEYNSSTEKYTPILIDFGKSTETASLLRGKRKMIVGQGKKYLAPEILKGGLFSVASDVYSVGRMLKGISSVVGFYPHVRALIKEATAETPELRPSLQEVVKELGAVTFS